MAEKFIFSTDVLIGNWVEDRRDIDWVMRRQPMPSHVSQHIYCLCLFTTLCKQFIRNFIPLVHQACPAFK